MCNIFRSDYHVHTQISPDSNCSMEEYCRVGIEKGILLIAFTDHYEWYHMKPEKVYFDQSYLEQYQNQLEKCRERYGQQIKILSGLEFGQMHLQMDEVKRLLNRYPFEFIIASVHKLNDIDLSKVMFQKDNVAEVTEAYYKSLYQTAKEGVYHVIGHINLVKRYSAKFGIIEPDEKYEKQIKEILNVVIQRGKGIEINTSGLRQSLGESLPSGIILDWYKEMGGQLVTFGSDAHRAKDLGEGISDAAKRVYLKE